MKKSISLWIFGISTVSLLVSLKLFWNMGIFVDEANTSPAAVCGGTFWLAMDWLRLGLLALLVILSLVQLARKA